MLRQQEGVAGGCAAAAVKQGHVTRMACVWGGGGRYIGVAEVPLDPGEGFATGLQSPAWFLSHAGAAHPCSPA